MATKNNKLDYSSVPTSVELENNSNQNKYTVNHTPRGGTGGGVTLSKLALVLMALGALLLIALAVGLTILFYPKCSHATPEALVQKSAVTAVRLPRTIQPLHYRIQLMPFLDQRNFTSNGAVTITLDAKEDTDKIAINLYDITMDKESIKIKHLNDSKYITVGDQIYDNISQIYTISLGESLRKGEQYELEMKFIGQLKDNMQGFYRSKYVDPKTGATKWMASTQFSPTDARRAFPCFDEPAFKSKFTISIARPNNMSTISNMPKKSTDLIVDKTNWEWDHYSETPLMSTYLVAFVVSDLQAYRYNSSGKLLTVWTRMKSVDQTRLVIDLSPKILNYFEGYFTIKFPLPKIDIVAVPDFGFSAMENWGLITFRETAILFDEKTATIDDERSIVTVLTHELAHQWFGNLVTPKWWDDLWLKEGFANYLVYLGVGQVNPHWKIMDEFLLSEVYNAFAVDFLKSSRPISFDVISTEDIRQSFDSLSYSKGASVIRMLSHIIGEDNFRMGLIKFLNEHKYSNANRDDLWNALTPPKEGEGSVKLETSIKEIMDSWTRQSGFPVVTASRNKTSGVVHVSQKRFLLSKTSEDKSLWWIPISYTSDAFPRDDTTPKAWLNNVKESSFVLKAQNWWILNVYQTGYYIVNYDEQNWKELVANIAQLPPVTRVQLISDSMNLARANLLDYDIPLRMLTNIGVGDEQFSFVSHWAALDKVTYLYNMLISTPIYKSFENFIFRIFNRAFAKFDIYEQPSDDYSIRRMRRLIVSWNCKSSSSKCTNDAQLLFRKWQSKPNEDTIPPNLQEVVFCTSIRQGDEREWDILYARYKSSNSIYEKNIILDALGCSETPWILNRYLDMMLKNNTDIRKQDSSRVFKAVAKNSKGSSLAFSYLRTHWQELNDHYGPAFSIVSKMVAELPTYMNTPYQLAELEEFKNSNLNNLGTSAQAFDRAIEIVKNNIEWMDHSYQSIEKWLEAQMQHYG